MRSDFNLGKVRPVHPYQWLWEPLEDDPGFLLRPMFGGRAAYLDGRLALYFAAKAEPWRGLFVCTERSHHAALMAAFPILQPHSVLPKWLYLPEAENHFESIAQQLVNLARRRDSRIGILPPPRKRRGRR